MRTGTTVFLVDDDPAALDSLRWLMETRGFSVEAYCSASDYLDAYDPHKPGCLVLDVRMPEMDGLALQEKLVAIGERIPIIFVTAHGDVASSVQAMKAGAIDFLEKPVDDEVLLKLVQNALEKDSLRRHQEPQKAEIEMRIQRLSPREREVMELLYAGKSMKRIAIEFGITAQTVAKHRTRVLEKMKVAGDTELVRLLAAHRRQEP